MKKLITFVIVFFAITVRITAQASEDGSFRITSGIDASKSSEATFDVSRTISGTAEKGTIININITNGKNTESFDIEVGSSRYFSFSANFEEGRNDILITAKMPDGSTQQIETAIKRKNTEIKSSLENSIALPGECE